MTTEQPRPSPAGRAATSSAARPVGPKRRRRHAATGARILAGSLSAAATLGLAAAMANGAAPPAPSSGPTPAPGALVVVRPSDHEAADGAGEHAAIAAAPLPRVMASDAPAVTVSRAS